MTRKELKTANALNYPLLWNDPDPIPGNDYTITKIWDIFKDTSMIEYGDSSEAEVFNTEIIIKKVNKSWY